MNMSHVKEWLRWLAQMAWVSAPVICAASLMWMPQSPFPPWPWSHKCNAGFYHTIVDGDVPMLLSRRISWADFYIQVMRALCDLVSMMTLPQPSPQSTVVGCTPVLPSARPVSIGGPEKPRRQRSWGPRLRGHRLDSSTYLQLVSIALVSLGKKIQLDTVNLRSVLS